MHDVNPLCDASLRATAVNMTCSANSNSSGVLHFHDDVKCGGGDHTTWECWNFLVFRDNLPAAFPSHAEASKISAPNAQISAHSARNADLLEPDS